MIDVFSRERFEQALPKHRQTGATLWKTIGLRHGEFCYTMTVKPGVLIHIRSSVKGNGLAAQSGKDSIRCWLAANDDGAPLSSKAQRWITRVPGWDARLTETLRDLWKMGKQLANCPKHPENPVMMRALKTKNGPNKGRWFRACPDCGHWDCWLTEEE